MSEKHLEELKKICLICGCHTNQAINIYEPRGGPNIVELIQAKFKFQPVNEDKYLCYSCNNWLINWHSLQTLSPESNGQPGKSRSRINDSIPEEETEENSELHNEQKQQEEQHHYHQHHHPHYERHHQQDPQQQQQQQYNSNKKRNGFYFSRRPTLGWHRIRKIRRKRIQSCVVCGRSIQKRAKRSSSSSCEILNAPNHKISITKRDKCTNCKRILKWRAKYSKALIREERRKLKELKTSKIVDESGELHFRTNLINHHHHHHHHHQRQRPLVDGKVVAMLRRLGTTLTRESDCSFGTNNGGVITTGGSGLTTSDNIRFSLLPSSSLRSTSDSGDSGHQYAKRPLDDDEILIDFNTAITEVLPIDLAKYPIAINSIVNGEVKEQDVIDNIDIDNDDDDDDDNDGDSMRMISKKNEKQQQQPEPEEESTTKLSLEALYSRIPKCVTVSVVNAPTLPATAAPSH